MPSRTWKTGFQEMGNGIYCYVTNGKTMMSNCMMVVGEQCALVFDVLSTKGMTEDFVRECRRCTDKPIQYLVISHCHGDHFLGAKALPKVTTLGHISLKNAFDTDRASPRAATLQERYPHLDFTDSTYPYPQIYLRDGCVIDLGNRMVEVKAMGCCHTEGDLSLYVPDAKWMALADVLFRYVVPPTTSGDIDHWIATLESIEASDAEHFLPGHGPVCDKGAVTELKDYLCQVREQAKAVVRGELRMQDEIPSPLEAHMIEAGWSETARTVFSTEQYAAKLNGVAYHVDMNRILGLEASRNS